jgi:hypothetical protein
VKLSLGAILAAVALAATACTIPAPTVKTTGNSPSQPNPAATSAAPPAKVGSTITLTGNSAGEKMDVTVIRFIPDAKSANQFFTPDKGKRFVAVQFRLVDTGSLAYSDSPSNGTVVIDSAGQQYDAWPADVVGCQSFPAAVKIAVGSSALGCVVYEVSKTAAITGVQFALDSGFASDTGQWHF